MRASAVLCGSPPKWLSASGRTASDKFERYVAKDRHNANLQRKALSAITAKMARVVHAVVKTGADYRPFVEAAVPSGGTPLRMGREGASATL